MNIRLHSRLVLDLLAVSLLLAAFAYDWLGNVAHEIFGTGMFLLLISHNVFNRRWYGAVGRHWREPRRALAKLITLCLLFSMLILLATSILISQTIFSAFPLRGTFTVRQIHALVAYLALFLAASHLGLQWSMIMKMVRGGLRMSAGNSTRTFAARAAAASIAAYGLWSLGEVDVGSKLLMRTNLDFWDFETATLSFFLHHIAIVGLFVGLTYYGQRMVALRGFSAGRSPG